MSFTHKLFAFSAFLFASSHFISSIRSSFAFSGPSVQSTSNPVFNLSGKLYMNTITTTTIWTNTTQSDLIVTTILQNEASCRFTVDGNTEGLVNVFGYSLIDTDKPSSAFLTGNAKLKIAVGSTLDLRHFNNNGNNCHYYVEGYFVRP